MTLLMTLYRGVRRGVSLVGVAALVGGRRGVPDGGRRGVLVCVATFMVTPTLTR